MYQWIRVCFLAGCMRDKSALPSLHDCALVFQSKTRVETLGTLGAPQSCKSGSEGFGYQTWFYNHYLYSVLFSQPCSNMS